MEYRWIYRLTTSELEFVIRTGNGKINKGVKKVPSASYLQPFMFISKHTRTTTTKKTTPRHKEDVLRYGVGPCEDHWKRLGSVLPIAAPALPQEQG